MKLKSFFAALVLGAGISLTGATAAQADDSSEYPSCTNLVGFGVGAAYGGGEYTGSGDWYAYSTAAVVSSSSACEDITIYWQYFDEWRWRVRFYPSSGGSYVNSWKSPCGRYCAVMVATAVSNGTWFRLEGHHLGTGGVQTTYPRQVDVYL